MTTPHSPTRRRTLLIAAVVVLLLAVVTAWYLLTRDQTDPAPPTTTVETAPATTRASTTTTRLVAADLTTTTTAPTTTTTQPSAATVVVAQPTTTSTTAPPASTTKAASTTTAAAVGEHVHGDLVSEGEVCHTHDGTVTEHCHTVEYPTTTAPDPAASGDCPGNYHHWYKVRDDCVLSEARREMLAFQAGSHAQRMAAIRDGHRLGGVFVDLQVATEQYYGDDAANDLAEITSLWADADNQGRWTIEIYGAQWIQPDLIHVRLRPYRRDGSYIPDGWNVVPFTFVDGAWKVSYQGFCRLIDASIEFVEGAGGTLNPCPPDPRPGLVVWEEVVASYGPTDDPTHPQLPRTPGW